MENACLSALPACNEYVELVRVGLREVCLVAEVGGMGEGKARIGDRQSSQI